MDGSNREPTVCGNVTSLRSIDHQKIIFITVTMKLVHVCFRSEKEAWIKEKYVEKRFVQSDGADGPSKSETC